MMRKKLFFHFYPNRDQNQKCGTYFFYRIITVVFKYRHLTFLLSRKHLAPFFVAGSPCSLSTCYLFKYMRKAFHTFPFVRTVGNTFPPLITVGNRLPPVITVENTFPLVITVETTFPLVLTVGNTFPPLITVGKNDGSSFFLKKRGTTEMSSIGHRTQATDVFL